LLDTNVIDAISGADHIGDACREHDEANPANGQRQTDKTQG